MRHILLLTGLVVIAAAALADGFSSPDGTVMLQRRVQATSVTTDSSGNWSVTWVDPFVSSSPTVLALPVNTNANPGVCNVATRSTTGASGKCWLSAGVTVSALGSIVNVFSAAGSIPVMIIGREPTQ